MSSVFDQIWPQFEPVQSDDLETYAGGISEMFQTADDYASDGPNGEVGWSILLDLDRIPDENLDWLAQFIGVHFPSALSPDEKRDRIRNTDGWNRGTPDAIKAAPLPFLTGTKTVILRERFPDAYSFQVLTKVSETPDAAIVLAALIEQKPAGLILTYNTIAGNDYQQLLTNHPLYSNVFADYATYQGVLNDAPGT